MGLFGYNVNDPAGWQDPNQPNLIQNQPDPFGAFVDPNAGAPNNPPPPPADPGSPFNGLLPGDNFPGPGQPPGGAGFPLPNLFPNAPTPGTAPPGQEGLTQGFGQPGQPGAGGVSEGPFDPSKFMPVKTQSGLVGQIPLPDPSKQNDVDGYRQWYESLRKALGLGDTWNPNDIDKLKEYFDKLGIKFQAKPGEKWSGRMYIPDGHGGFFQVDAINGFVNYGHTDQSMSFVPGYKPSGGGTSGGGAAAGKGGVSGLPGLGGGTGSGSGLFGADKFEDLYQMLMDRAKQSLKIDRMDPIIRNQSDAFAAMQNRARRDFLNQTAERAGAFSNMGAERRSSAEKVGQSTSAFEAQLMGTELTARRAEITDALHQMGSLLTTEQQLALTRELGLIDAQLRQLAINNQNNQFYDQLGFTVQDRATILDLIRRGLISG